MLDLLDPKLDYIFKNIFGTEENKPVLLSFLNSLFKGNPQVDDFRLANTDIVKILAEDKASRLDIKATCDDGTKIDIEIQCRNTGEIPQRAFHYLANMMPHIVKRNESYKQSSVIGIWILGENVTDRKNAISEAYMTFQEQHPDPYQKMTDTARIFFIELPKFNPKNEDMHDLLTGWISFLQNPIFMDESFLKTKEVKQAMDTLKYISADDEVRAISELRQKTINDHNSELTIAKEEGLAIGEEMGVEKGKIEGEKIGVEKGKIEGERVAKESIARNLLKAGVDVKIIAASSELSIEEIKQLGSVAYRI